MFKKKKKYDGLRIYLNEGRHEWVFCDSTRLGTITTFWMSNQSIRVFLLT